MELQKIATWSHLDINFQSKISCLPSLMTFRVKLEKSNLMARSANQAAFWKRTMDVAEWTLTLHQRLHWKKDKAWWKFWSSNFQKAKEVSWYLDNAIHQAWCGRSHLNGRVRIPAWWQQVTSITFYLTKGKGGLLRKTYFSCPLKYILKFKIHVIGPFPPVYGAQILTLFLCRPCHWRPGHNHLFDHVSRIAWPIFFKFGMDM